VDLEPLVPLGGGPLIQDHAKLSSLASPQLKAADRSGEAFPSDPESRIDSVQREFDGFSDLGAGDTVQLMHDEDHPTIQIQSLKGSVYQRPSLVGSEQLIRSGQTADPIQLLAQLFPSMTSLSSNICRHPPSDTCQPGSYRSGAVKVC